MMKKVLITGGAGFIGSYIARKLLQREYEVIIYDAFIQYISPLNSFYQKYLEHRFSDIKDKTLIIRGDTRNKHDIRRTILAHKPNIIIHLAAMPIADLSFIHSEETIESILHGTVNVLEVIRETDFVEHFVYASSSMIYGDFQYEPADEEHPKKPKDIYGGTKLAGEILVETFGRRYNLGYTIVRPSGVYGPTDVNRRVSQIFLENAMLGKEVVLYDGGNNKIDFTYVEDTAEGFVLASLSEKAKGQTFNITRGEGRTLKEFADIIKSYFPNLKIKTKPAQLFRPKRGSLNISKAKKLLNYNPQYSLEEGIKKYLEFLKTI